MPTLTLTLEEGFEGDSVTVKVNDQRVYANDDVKTRYQISRADTFEVAVDGGSGTVDVDLPDRGLSKRIPFQIDERLYVGISVVGDAIDSRESKEPFGYV